MTEFETEHKKLWKKIYPFNSSNKTQIQRFLTPFTKYIIYKCLNKQEIKF